MEEKITKLIKAIESLTEKSEKYFADIEYVPRHKHIQIHIRDIKTFNCAESIDIYTNVSGEKQLEKIIKHIENYEEEV